LLNNSSILNWFRPSFNQLVFGERARLLFLLFVGLCLGACQPSIKTPQNTLVVGLEAPPLTLDPRLASDAYSSKITALLHNGLFRLNERMEIVQDLTESYEQTSSHHYKITLKKGVLFHDGHELTAEDVKYTLESVLDPTLASPFKGTLSRIALITIKDPWNLEIDLKEDFSPFLSALTMGIIQAGGSHPALGTGPFSLESMKPNEEIVLHRNEKYFQPLAKAKIEKIIFRIVTDDNLRILELKNHRLDLLQNNIPPMLLESLKKDGDLVVETTEGINMTYLGFNLQKGPLKSLEVRKAIAYALDIPALIEYRMGRLAKPATGILSPSHWAYEPEVTPYAFDPKKARELLDKSGYPDPDGLGPAPRFVITYKTSTKKDRIGLARLIARYLKDVGIEIRILPYEWGTFFHDINTGNFEMFSLTWVGVTEPDIYYYVFHSSQKPPEGANRGGFNDEVIDRLTTEGRRLQDRVKRKEVYKYIQKTLADELPIVPLWYEDNFAVFSKQVAGVRLRPNASFDWMTEVYKN